MEVGAESNSEHINQFWRVMRAEMDSWGSVLLKTETKAGFWAPEQGGTHTGETLSPRQVV